jgi:hypothetical protein
MNLPHRHAGVRFGGTVVIAVLLLAALADPAAAAPSISGFSPTNGPAGCQVIISGSGFSGVTAATFNGHGATFTQNSSTQITATVPASATTGPIGVTQPNGTATSSNDFTVATSSCPTITSFSPGSGPVGTSVTINGTNFTGVTAVLFNTTSVTSYTVNSSTKITATVPSGATSGPIKVTASGGTGSGLSNFTVTTSVPAPTISSFSPPSGPVGTSVTINGTNFSGSGFTTSAVTFNNVTASFTVNSSIKITATVPSGATDGKIRVTTPGGTATSSTSFDVTTQAAPTISSFSPTSGPVGTSVTINGTNFVNVSSVTFNNVTASSTTNSSTKITATVPSGATDGKIRVTTPGGTATSSSSFDVTTQAAPTISSFSPTSGPVGTSVTINGTNFVNVSSVTFNNVTASSTTNSSTKITATVPSGATDGKIRVTTPGGTATSSKSFDVTTPAKPTISSFSPTSGPVGTSVTIIGTNFTGATAVRFNNVAASSFAVNSSTKVTATVPSGATTGKVTVTTPGGTATSATNFTVTGLTHFRNVSLRLRRHLRASGNVIVTDGFTSCAINMPVKIQRRRISDGEWRTVTLAFTDSSGFYSAHLADRSGEYRARAIRVVLASGDICGRATSGIKLHRV